MNSVEFERIKLAIAKNNEESVKAKGVCEQIQKDWKEKYGFETVDEAKEKLSELESERNAKIERRDKLMDKLEELVDGWSD